MEKVLTPEERIRKAEISYYGRQNKQQFNNQVKVGAGAKGIQRKKHTFLSTFFIQLLSASLIFGTIHIYQNQNIMGVNVKTKIKEIINYEIKIPQIINQENSETKIENISSGKEINQTLPEEKIEETLAAVETVSTPEIIEEASSINQMQENAKYIKENYSIAKPLEGQITSRYGVRNSSYANVTKYHTGIDIAENTGVAIYAAMEGTVELVSTQGDLGNHISIVNGDVSTVYAHCSTMLVKEGQQVKQGEKIAEVGATGNVTGPHLHFEIKRNKNYVDPDLVIQF